MGDMEHVADAVRYLADSIVVASAIQKRFKDFFDYTLARSVLEERSSRSEAEVPTSDARSLRLSAVALAARDVRMHETRDGVPSKWLTRLYKVLDELDEFDELDASVESGDADA